MRLHRCLGPVLLVAAGCAGADPDGNADVECDGASEVLASTSEALSSVSCGEASYTGYKSGTPFSISVVTVDGKKVEKNTANAYYVMAKAAAKAGVTLKVVSGFRTMSEQKYLYACYVNCNCNSCNLAAKPGYSNHQSGHALDLNTASSGVLSWLNLHAGSYGFKRTVAKENWHWEWWGGGPGGGICDVASSCQPSAEVCNGKDDDCDSAVDEGGVCELDELLVPSLGSWDGQPFSDIDGDGAADFCARAATGVICNRATSAGPGPTIEGPDLSNDKGWDARPYYSTLRMGDLDGNGKADVCVRAIAGIRCWLSTNAPFDVAVVGPEWTDAGGWTDPAYYTTLRLVDVTGDGKDDLCARTAAGIRCHPFTGKGFGAAISGPLADSEGWRKPEYYATLRMADVDGDKRADLCARAATGFSCWLSTGSGFGQRIDLGQMSNASGWSKVQYWSTIRLADIDGDGRYDVCARAAAGMRCWRSLGQGFGSAIVGPELSDAKGFDAVPYYSTLRMADVDGDAKADICVRSAGGVRCYLSNGSGFAGQLATKEMSDGLGWNKPQYYWTLRTADVDGDGKSELCGRGSKGVICLRSEAGGLVRTTDGPAWSNDNGWDDAMYYSTLTLGGRGKGAPPSAAGPCDPTDPSCNGQESAPAPSSDWSVGDELTLPDAESTPEADAPRAATEPGPSCAASSRRRAPWGGRWGSGMLSGILLFGLILRRVRRFPRLQRRRRAS